MFIKQWTIDEAIGFQFAIPHVIKFLLYYLT
jgi:hypothetical protein